MSFWNRLLGRQIKSKSKNGSNSFVVSFDPFQSTPDAMKECNATYMSCISQYANAVSKMRPSLYYKGEKCADPLNYLLCVKPNKAQNAINFWKQVIISYFESNVAAIYLDWDYSGPKRTLNALWPIDVSDANFELKEYQDDLYFSFFLEGKPEFASMEDVIVLTNTPSTKNPYVSHSLALNNLVNVINADFKGLAKSLELSNVIRFIAVSNTVLPTKTLEQRQTAFSDLFAKVGSDGIFYIDNAQSMTQVQNTAKWASSEDIKEFKAEILDYFHIPQSVVNSSATDDVVGSWYELSVEPIVEEICEELTEKLLTQRERDFGNTVEVNFRDFYTASLAHRISLANTVITSGVYYPNDIRKIVGVDLLPDKDNELVKRIDRVDTSSDSNAKPKEGQENE
jgi:HK97 family phage portal protein